MSSNGGGRDEKSQKLSHVKDGFKGDVNVVAGNGPGSQRYDDELQISKIDGNVKAGGDLAVVQRNLVSQEPLPQQQAQGSLSHWDRFLHVGSVKVLLVENDDSTRHIVTALLRNCNYEVIEAANGFQAWKILEDLSNHIDIVLTEVVMPSLSGIALLCKIMSHKTRKNIPVIMMSSHDSMGLVFKCLSKGAADFLLKPIRKNELKNLWQHVWRRCHSSSGSGSESATNAQKSVNSKRSDSMIGDDIGSSHDGSDDGSGTQSSWTKQAVELDSPQAASPCHQTTEHPDSTCGVVIHSAETAATKDYQNQEVQEDNVGNGNGLVVEGSRDSKLQISHAVMAPNVHNGIEHLQDFDPTKMIRGDDIINTNVPQLVNGEFEAQKEPKHILDTNTKVIIDDSRETITELSLKRPRESKGVKNGLNVLRHSELSAFTRSGGNKNRYTTTSNATRTGITSSGFRLDNRSESMKKESTRDAHSDGFLIYQGLNEQAVAAKSGDIPPSDSLNPPQVDHIHHHHHHHVHHYHHIGPKQPPLSNHEDSGRNELAESAPHCGSSNVLGGAVEVNIENCSLNISGSGSKHGSNGQNGSSTAVNLQGKNVESGGGLGEKSGSGGGGGEHGIDQHKSTQREAALMKFREKRKDRCFQKKVRYQNRKLLAEQRPRVRGQFVKQTGRESSSNAEDP